MAWNRSELRGWAFWALWSLGSAIACAPVGGGLPVDGGDAGALRPEAGPRLDGALERDGGPPSSEADAAALDTSVPTDGGFEPDAAVVDGSLGVFVAVGSVGRTITSFDDGESWTADQSDASGVICTSGSNADPAHYCYEGDRTARGVAYVDGHFFTTFAWAREPGRSNSVRQSGDGRSWTAALTPGGFGGLSAGLGTVVLGGPSGTTYFLRSTDLGRTWTQVDNGYGGWVNVRHAAFVSALGGRFLFFADGNAATGKWVVSSADGEQWLAPSLYPAECPTQLRLQGGFGSVGDRIVIVGQTGATCFSDDGGTTWTVGDSIPRVSSHDVISAHGRIYVWSGHELYTTQDGATWTGEALTPSTASIGAVAHSPDTGTFVAVTAGYLNGYGAQRFYRSSDGVLWEELPADRYVASHPILGIAFGRVP